MEQELFLPLPRTDAYISCSDQNWLFYHRAGETVVFLHCPPESSQTALQNWGSEPALVFTREET